jgi:hypothetical protein
MPKKANPLGVKVRDVVLLDFTEIFNDRGSFAVRVLEMKENMEGSLIIRYERMDGIQEYDDGFALCNISFVKKIIKPAAYVVRQKVRVNIFALDRGNHLIEKRGGLRVGHFDSLVMEALATVQHVDLSYFYQEDRTKKMYERAGWPGKVSDIDSEMRRWRLCTTTVRWKIFKRWVHCNAQRLIATKTEYVAHVRERNRKLNEEMCQTLGDDMDRIIEDDYFV